MNELEMIAEAIEAEATPAVTLESLVTELNALTTKFSELACAIAATAETEEEPAETEETEETEEEEGEE